MSKNRWVSAAKIITEIRTSTVGGTAAATQTYTLTLPNGAAVTYTAITGDTNTTIATALAALAGASAYPEFQEWQWTSALAVITATMTANSLGYSRPGSITSSASGGTASLTDATVTAATGPNFLDNVLNWSLGVLPITGDDIWFDFVTVPVQYNLQALNGITALSLNMAAAYSGFVGLPEVNTDGSSPYEEWRPTYLQLPATTVNLGLGQGSGIGLLKLDTLTVQTALNCWLTGSNVDASIPQVFIWKGTHASNTVNIRRGTFAAAPFAGEVATIANYQQSFIDDQANDVSAQLAVGCTLATLSMTGGTLEVNAAFTTLTKNAGVLTTYGSGAIGTVTDYSGTWNFLGTSTVTTYNAGNCAFVAADAAYTITTLNVTAEGFSYSDPHFRGTVTSGFVAGKGVDLVNCQLNLGPGRTLTAS